LILLKPLTRLPLRSADLSLRGEDIAGVSASLFSSLGEQVATRRPMMGERR